MTAERPAIDPEWMRLSKRDPLREELAELLDCPLWAVHDAVQGLLRDLAKDPRERLREGWQAEQRRWPGSSSEFKRAIRMAYMRGLEWNLTPGQYEMLTAQECSYCGASLGNGLGLDRIDNDRGYLPNNVNPCCGPCNRLRGRKSIGVWMRQVESDSFAGDRR